MLYIKTKRTLTFSKVEGHEAQKVRQSIARNVTIQRPVGVRKSQKKKRLGARKQDADFPGPSRDYLTRLPRMERQLFQLLHGVFIPALADRRIGQQ